MRWLHFSSKPIAEFDRARKYSSPRADKPSGFWISPDEGHNWRAWREEEDWGIPKTEHVYDVTFAPSARLLTLKSAGDLIELHKRFPRGRADDFMPFYSHYEQFPSWAAMAEQYDGILIPQYHWECRLSDSVSWYYGWDCASGCIWNLNAVESLSLSHTLARAVMATEAT